MDDIRGVLHRIEHDMADGPTTRRDYMSPTEDIIVGGWLDDGREASLSIEQGFTRLLGLHAEFHRRYGP